MPSKSPYSIKLQITYPALYKQMDPEFISTYSIQMKNEATNTLKTPLFEDSEIFKLLVNSVEDYAIFALDKNGIVMTWNTGAVKLNGYTSDEIIGTHFSKFYTAKDIARNHPQEELKIAKEKGKFEEEGWRVKKDGSTFWANVNINALKDSEGNLYGFAKVTRDLTEKKLIQEKLVEEERNAATLKQIQENERILDQVFSEAPSFMTLISVPEFRYLKSNEQHFKLMQKWDIIGKKITEVEPGLEKQGFIKNLEEVVKTKKPFIGRDLPIIYSAGNADEWKTYLDFVYQPLVNSDGEVYAIAAQGNDVTERVLARKSIENERENLRNLFRQTPEIVCILEGENHTFVFVNEAHVRTLGFDATGMSVRDAQPDSVEIYDILDDVYRTGVTAELKEIPVTVTGSLRYFNLTYAAKRNEYGKIDGIMILGTEITENILSRIKIAESLKATKRSEDQLRLLANSIPQIAWISNSIGQPLWYNRRWYEYTGMTNEFNDSTLVIDPSYMPEIKKRSEASYKTGQPFEYEFPIKGANGQYRWFLARMEALKNASGEIELWFGTSTDIDENKRNDRRYKLLAETANIFTQPLDVEARLQALADITVANLATWCSIAIDRPGEDPYEAAIAHVDSNYLLHARELFRDYPTDWNAPTGAPNVIRTGQSELYPNIPADILKAAAKDERHLDLLESLKMNSAMVVPLAAAGKILGAITFISSDIQRHYDDADLKLAEELGRRAGAAVENSYLYEEARRAIKMRDEFLSVASHELKTPLTSLKLKNQLRKRNIEKDFSTMFSVDKLKTYFDDDERQLNRLVKLIDDMLDITRLNAGKFQLNFVDMNINLLMNDVVERLMPQIQSQNINIKIVAHAEIVGVWDRHLIDQVFVNLLTNAIKYGEGKPIDISIDKNSTAAFITVKDQGIGIAPKDQERVFKRFERAVSPMGISGLGLGLHIARQLINAHDGNITVKSEFGKGSSFTVELPLTLEKNSNTYYTWASE